MELEVKFYRTESGNEPVRDWLKSLDSEDRKTIGEDILTVQRGWPIGYPTVKPVDSGLWEVRSNLKNRIARILFTVKDHKIYLVHGFIKKTERISKSDLDLAKKRAARF